MKRGLLSALLITNIAFAQIGVQHTLEDMPLRTGFEPKIWTCDVGQLAVDSKGKYVCVDCPSGTYNPKTGYCEGPAYSITGCPEGTVYQRGLCVAPPKTIYEYKCNVGVLKGNKCVVKANKKIINQEEQAKFYDTGRDIYIRIDFGNAWGFRISKNIYGFRVVNGKIKPIITTDLSKDSMLFHLSENRMLESMMKSTQDILCYRGSSGMLCRNILENNEEYKPNGSWMDYKGILKDNGAEVKENNYFEYSIEIKGTKLIFMYNRHSFFSMTPGTITIDLAKPMKVEKVYHSPPPDTGYYGVYQVSNLNFPDIKVELISDGKGHIRNILRPVSNKYVKVSPSSPVYDTGWLPLLCPLGKKLNPNTLECGNSTSTQKTTYTCPVGFTLQGTECVKPAQKKKKLDCPTGTVYQNGQCIATYKTKTIICPKGFGIMGNKCITSPTVRKAQLK